MAVTVYLNTVPASAVRSYTVLQYEMDNFLLFIPICPAIPQLYSAFKLAPSPWNLNHPSASKLWKLQRGNATLQLVAQCN